MRLLHIGTAGCALVMVSPSIVSAQTARNTPDGIICAMTGSCEAQAAATGSAGRQPVGDERAFSLARANPAAGTTPAAHAAASGSRPASVRSAAPRRAFTKRVAAAPRVRPGGGIDMLVTFRRGSADMTPQARAEARAFVQAMAAPQMANMRFAIEGHTDSTGNRDTNVTLSQRRADSVADYLVAQGVDRSRLTTKGYGPDRPLQGVPASAPGNRRVEFVKAS